MNWEIWGAFDPIFWGHHTSLSRLNTSEEDILIGGRETHRNYGLEANNNSIELVLGTTDRTMIGSSEPDRLTTDLIVPVDYLSGGEVYF